MLKLLETWQKSVNLDLLSIVENFTSECLIYGFIVFPTISYGLSFEHDPLFNIDVWSLSLRNFLFDIIHSVIVRLRSQDVIILNGHHGNVEALNKLVKIRSTNVIIDRFKDTLSLHSYWHFMEHEFDHAGFVETSIMLAISDKVKMKKAKKGLITKGLSEKEIQRINKLSTQPGGFPQVTKNGVWGDPTGATKKDGEKFLAEIVKNLAKECQS